jgi:hypothetical protein
MRPGSLRPLHDVEEKRAIVPWAGIEPFAAE